MDVFTSSQLTENGGPPGIISSDQMLASVNVLEHRITSDISYWSERSLKKYIKTKLY